MMAKSSISRNEVFEAIALYIKDKYGVEPQSITIPTNFGVLEGANFQFEVKPVKDGIPKFNGTDRR